VTGTLSQVYVSMKPASSRKQGRPWRARPCLCGSVLRSRRPREDQIPQPEGAHPPLEGCRVDSPSKRTSILHLQKGHFSGLPSYSKVFPQERHRYCLRDSFVMAFPSSLKMLCPLYRGRLIIIIYQGKLSLR